MEMNLPAMNIQKCVITLASCHKLQQQNPHGVTEFSKDIIKHSPISSTKSPLTHKMLTWFSSMLMQNLASKTLQDFLPFN